MTDAGIDGGPVLDDGGRLVGMLDRPNTAPSGTQTNYAVRVDRLRAVLAAFDRGLAPGWIGWALTFSSYRTEPPGVIYDGIDGVRGGYSNGAVLLTAVNEWRARRRHVRDLVPCGRAAARGSGDADDHPPPRWEAGDDQRGGERHTADPDHVARIQTRRFSARPIGSSRPSGRRFRARGRRSP